MYIIDVILYCTIKILNVYIDCTIKILNVYFIDVTTEESLMNVLLNKRTFDAAKDPSYFKGNKRKVPKREGEHSTPAKLALVSNAIQP